MYCAWMAPFPRIIFIPVMLYLCAGVAILWLEIQVGRWNKLLLRVFGQE
jgi:hypothetical protein